MSARTLVPVAMVSVLLMTTAAFAQTGGSPGATAPGNPSAPAAGGAAPNTTGTGMSSPKIRSQQSQRCEQPQQSGHATIAAAPAPELAATLDVVVRVLGRSAISG